MTGTNSIIKLTGVVLLMGPIGAFAVPITVNFSGEIVGYTQFDDHRDTSTP